jgi:hypothetical protein
MLLLNVPRFIRYVQATLSYVVRGWRSSRSRSSGYCSCQLFIHSQLCLVYTFQITSLMARQSILSLRMTRVGAMAAPVQQRSKRSGYIGQQMNPASEYHR